MAFNTTDFVNTLAALSVTGVTRNYTEPPQQVNSTDLPCMWPMVPDAEHEIISLTSGAGLLTVTCDLMILIEMELQDRNSVKFSATLAIIDALDAALAAETDAGIDGWNISSNFDEKNNWQIIATVIGSG